MLLTEVAPLARYGHLNTLGPWADLATRRTQAIWVLVPQLPGTHGAIVDPRPLPLAAPGQFLRLDPDWVASQPGVPVRGRNIMTATAGVTNDLQQQVIPWGWSCAPESRKIPRWRRGTRHRHAMKRTNRRVLGAWRGDRVPRRRWPGCRPACSSGSARRTRSSNRSGYHGRKGRRQEASTPTWRSSASTRKSADREWLEAAIADLAGLPATQALVDAHSALRLVSLSGERRGN